ncbi:hypothetical protein HMPREF9989_10396 [Staphylococcus epidermidis NIHLM057]|nr:hypothetical protein HMPREF9989_10396 [Staphylococcus epidermidis NIHLM057]EJD93534.1 hypothetical protein HMPREF9988_09270 [Staphylococcus epidermidis NIHLM053]
MITNHCRKITEDQLRDNGDRNQKSKTNVLSINLFVLAFVLKSHKKKAINY